MSNRKKYFVLDTNVILHDNSCLYQFEQNDIVLPITVLEELDHFKKGNETINFHAREFSRELDTLSGDKLFRDGVRIASHLGKIIVRLEQEFHSDLSMNFPEHNADHRILNIAYHLSLEKTDGPVILVSKDVNLRMKAKSIGLKAEDYKSDHVSDISALYTGHRILEGVSSDLINLLYKEPFEIPRGDLKPEEDLVPNECMIIRNDKHSALATYNPLKESVIRIDKQSAYGITPRNAEQTFALHALMDINIPLVTLTGKAGTGKTLLALAAALEKRKYYRQISIARPIVPLSNKDIGYLPGDIQSKIDPFMQPLWDNLAVIQNQFKETENKYHKIKDLLDDKKLVIQALSYIRGRSMVKTYFIVDEAQNLTPHEVKTIITRAGEGTKVIFTGDIFQIDHPYLNSHSNGLSALIEKMKGQNLYAHINLVKGERSELAELASSIL